ncbi:MAG: BatB protein [Flavobacteriales bacterium]|nr:BatB protein [Flavobacteriales bacterium]
MDFAKPELLNLFFGILVLTLVFYIYFIWQRDIVNNQFNKDIFKKINPNYSSILKIIHFIIRLIIVCLLIFALAGPRLGSKLKTVTREGVDVVFALDISKSMLVEDVAPNRLLKSIQIISKAIDDLVSDRIGIIVYAGEALPLMPLSLDYSMAKLLIKSIDTDMLQLQGTDVSSAISLSNSFFDNDERSKIIYIISDGEEHEGDYQEEITGLVEKNTVICAINIGTQAGGPIPVKNVQKLYYKKNKNGDVVISKSSSEALQSISSFCNGSFIKTNNTSDAVEFIFNNMKNLDKSIEDEEVYSDYEDQFQWFLAFALFFLLIDLILTQKKINFIRKIIK